MDDERIKKGDIVNVYFSTADAIYDAEVIYIPTTPGDSYQLVDEHGNKYSVQNYDYMIAKKHVLVLPEEHYVYISDKAESKMVYEHIINNLFGFIQKECPWMYHGNYPIHFYRVAGTSNKYGFIDSRYAPLPDIKIFTASEFLKLTEVL